MTTLFFNNADIDVLLDTIAYAIEQVHDSYVPVLSSIGVDAMEEYSDEQAEEALTTLKAMHDNLSTLKSSNTGVIVFSK